MKDDLLNAQACIDWAVAEIPRFELRLQDWLRSNLEVIVKDLPAESTNDVVLIREREPFPIVFNVETGAYINTIRSSLDILAWALGKREFVLFPDEVYFPVARPRFRVRELQRVEICKAIVRHRSEIAATD